MAADRRTPKSQASSSSPRITRGLELRRSVLGADYVDAALASASEAMRPIQEFVTEYAWGAIWAREGLDLRTRSLVTIAMLIGLDQPGELRLHVQGALTNGCTPDEIREVMLHASVYVGVPKALAALGVAREVLEGAD